MRYVEYGESNRDVIILLHGGGLSWWNYREAAQLLQEDHHVVLPILDGHAGSDRAFTGIEDNAQALIELIDERFFGRVLLMAGLSLGGQVLLEVLSRRQDICQYAVVESASVLPSRLTHCMIAPTFGCSYGLIRQKWFAKLQFASLHINPELFEDYYRDTCGIKKRDLIAFTQASALYGAKDGLKHSKARVQVLAGEKESRAMKRSAEIIHERLANSELQVLPGLHHGEMSLSHAQDYAQLIKNLLNN